MLTIIRRDTPKSRSIVIILYKKDSAIMSHPNETPSYYVTVSNGRAQLRSSARTGVIQTFGSNIETAIVQGQAIIATSSKGVTYEYAIQNNYAILKRTFWR